MPLDGSILGNCAQEQMGALESDYGDREEVQVGAVMTIVQVLSKEGEGVRSEVRMRHNLADPYTAVGILRAAETTITKELR